MDGTRHEKVGIAIAAYVIGFTTAFIAFGMHNQAVSGQTMVGEKRHIQELANRSLNYKEIHSNVSNVRLDESGLYANIGGYERILSAKQSSLSTSVVQSKPTSGFFTEMHKPLISPDGWFVFFCEQIDASVSTCDPYVYSLFNDTIYPVMVGTVAPALKTDIIYVSWSDSNELQLNGYSSINPQTPWKLSENDVSVTVTEETPQVQ